MTTRASFLDAILGDGRAWAHAEEVPSATRTETASRLAAAVGPGPVGREGLDGTEPDADDEGREEAVTGVGSGAGARLTTSGGAWRGAVLFGARIGIGWVGSARLGIVLEDTGGDGGRREVAIVGARRGVSEPRGTAVERTTTGPAETAGRWIDGVGRDATELRAWTSSRRRLIEAVVAEADRGGERERSFLTRSGCFPRATSDSVLEPPARVDIEEATRASTDLATGFETSVRAADLGSVAGSDGPATTGPEGAVGGAVERADCEGIYAVSG